MYKNSYWKNRGNPWEYDSGPPKNLCWPRLFSETPNYRRLSLTALGSEKFRWHFGPMYFRGRTGAGRVKIVIIGQEGAQDECLAHRAFVGSTGSRLQYLLNFMGLDYSYLFVNTFVYPIYGQYASYFKWLAQNLESPIVQHRHDIFNYILKKNDVRLVVAVGKAAGESVITWVESRGGTGPDGTGDLSTCSGSFLDPKTRIVGVRHPGGAKIPGEIAEIKQSFQDAIDKINTWIKQDSAWLPPDPGMTRDLSLPYSFGKAAIPFRDLPFGITWRLGKGSTTSNRKDSQRSIQLFSASGKYNNSGDKIVYADSAPGTAEGYSEKPGDVPYEPQVADYRDYDKGPGLSFARLFMGGKKDLAWPDFSTLGVKSDISLGYGPIYRGRPGKATFLILADQQSHDDLFTGRALTGESGQRFQAFLKAMGITRSYCILRILPVDMLDLTPAKRKSIVTNTEIVKIYDAFLDKILAKKKTKLILTLGEMSATLIQKLQTAPIDVINLRSWLQSGALSDWQSAINSIKTKSYPKDITNPSFTYNGGRWQIPGYDLPYGTLKWLGSSGDRARRAKDSAGQWSAGYYKLFMPQWAFSLAPPPLSNSEANSIAKHP